VLSFDHRYLQRLLFNVQQTSLVPRPSHPSVCRLQYEASNILHLPFWEWYQSLSGWRIVVPVLDQVWTTFRGGMELDSLWSVAGQLLVVGHLVEVQAVPSNLPSWRVNQVRLGCVWRWHNSAWHSLAVSCDPHITVVWNNTKWLSPVVMVIVILMLEVLVAMSRLFQELPVWDQLISD